MKSNRFGILLVAMLASVDCTQKKDTGSTTTSNLAQSAPIVPSGPDPNPLQSNLSAQSTQPPSLSSTIPIVQSGPSGQNVQDSQIQLGQTVPGAQTVQFSQASQNLQPPPPNQNASLALTQTGAQNRPPQQVPPETPTSTFTFKFVVPPRLEPTEFKTPLNRKLSTSSSSTLAGLIAEVLTNDDPKLLYEPNGLRLLGDFGAHELIIPETKDKALLKKLVGHLMVLVMRIKDEQYRNSKIKSAFNKCLGSLKSAIKQVKTNDPTDIGRIIDLFNPTNHSECRSLIGLDTQILACPSAYGDWYDKLASKDKEVPYDSIVNILNGSKIFTLDATDTFFITPKDKAATIIPARISALKDILGAWKHPELVSAIEEGKKEAETNFITYKARDEAVMRKGLADSIVKANPNIVFLRSEDGQNVSYKPTKVYH